MSQGCQTKVQNCFSNTFGKWADMVSNRTTIVFCCSLVVFLGLAAGMTQAKSYEDEQFVWTPAENQSILNYRRAEDLFEGRDEQSTVFVVIAESTSDSLLTLEAF